MKKFQCAIVGAGNIGHIHAQAFAGIPQAELAAIYDHNFESAQKLAQRFSTQAVTSLEAILHDPAIDIVSICTPSGTHARIAVPAARNGKHLLVEKPLDITLESVDQILESARQNKVVLTGIFPSRFRIGTQKTYEAIQNGRLGQIVFIQGNVKWYRPATYYEGTWRGTLELDGGGALMNQSIHTIDLMLWFGGAVKMIYGHTATLHHQIEAEDSATALLQFRNGAQGVIQGATSCWPGDPARIEIHAERGTIVLEEGRIVRWDVQNATSEEVAEMLSLDAVTAGGSQDPMGISFEFHQLQIKDFIEAIQENRPPYVPGEEARKAVEVILAIYQSARTAQPVPL